MDNQFFTGTKRFSDSLGWYYIVTIKDDFITLKLYSDATNDFHKEKEMARKTYKGKISGNRIITQESSFVYKNSVLFELNNEGTWNEYREMKDHIEGDQDKENNLGYPIITTINTSMDLRFSVLIYAEKNLRHEDMRKLFDTVNESIKHIGKFEVDYSRRKIDETKSTDFRNVSVSVFKDGNKVIN